MTLKVDQRGLLRKLKSLDAIIGRNARTKLISSVQNDVINTIKQRTRKGYGVDPNSKRKIKLEKLEDSTKNYRKRYARNLSPETSSNKSNLTATGQLLDEISSRKNAQTLNFFIRSKPKKKLSGGYSKTTTKKVAEYVSEIRPFLDLSTGESRKLIKYLTNKILTQIARLR